AEPCFSEVKRPERKDRQTRILFAGRLLPDKGIYTLLAALHMECLKGIDYELTVTDAAGDTEDGQIILKLLQAHPRVNVIPARKSPQHMAELMAQQDIVVVPSTNSFWQETFGIVSVEAQHAGCRVVAANGGGLPETDCGSAILVNPDDPSALANGLSKAALLGPLTTAERLYSTTKFTLQASVSSLLDAMASTEDKATHKSSLPLLQKQGSLVREQLDMAISTISQISQIGLQLGRDQKLSQRDVRDA
ncbi:MAG TPA: glycosyltransferase, partial [Candidatus Saccharimonadales bacterium]